MRSYGDTKSKIVEFAADCLRQKGFDGFSYLDIAKAMNITKASVHHHFPKKEDLGLALCEWSKTWLLEGLAYFDQIAKTDRERLELFMRAALKHSVKENKLCPVSAFYTDFNCLPKSIQRKLKILEKIEHDWVQRVIKSGVESGEFNAVEDVEAIAALFLFACKGGLYHARVHGDDLFQKSMYRFMDVLLKS